MIRNFPLDASLIKQIHESPLQLAVAVTGGGSSVISELLATAGASATLLEAAVPYHAKALAEFLGGQPTSACSNLTARQLAMSAFERGVHLAGDASHVAGLGCTAALVTNRQRQGEDRCHLALQTATSTLDLTVPLDKTATSKAATRETQETHCREAAIHLVGKAAGIAELPSGYGQGFREHRASSEWQRLLQPALAHDCNGPALKAAPVKAIFPGAFNPLHAGHRSMLSAAESLLGSRVHCEISVKNVDKPSLDFIEMEKREAQFEGEPLIFTNAPTFKHKASCFPSAVFVVGLDTILRVNAPEYYGSTVARDAAIKHIADQGCRFLVFGRRHEGRFQTLEGISLTPALGRICDGVPEADFREDISSSELRQERGGQ